MNKIIIIGLFFLCSVTSICAQTMHTLIFANKEEKGRELDRTAEYNNMASFCREVATALGYKYNLRQHSGAEFTSAMAVQDINNLNVANGDIVIFYYDGHGCNWDDDEWPHMAFLDKQYWETTLYNQLKAKCKNAKLTICIAGCCNMDSEGAKVGKNRRYSIMDKSKLKTLFTGFSGNLYIKCSASKRGQYSYSCTGGSNPGNVYAICLRNAIYDATSNASESSPTWEAVMADAAKAAYNSTTNSSAGPQQPQHLLEASAVTTPTPAPTPSQQPTGDLGEASFKRVTANIMNLKDGTYIATMASFDTHHMNEQGGKIVAFVSNKEMKSIDFGSHYIHGSFSNKVILIKLNDVIAVSGKQFQIRVGIYDYKQKKYIAYSKDLNLEVK